MCGQSQCYSELVPVFVITAMSQQSKHASECGIDSLMEKPLNLPLLLAIIAGFLAESETERIRRRANPKFKNIYFENPPQSTPMKVAWLDSKGSSAIINS